MSNPPVISHPREAVALRSNVRGARGRVMAIPVTITEEQPREAPVAADVTGAYAR